MSDDPYGQMAWKIYPYGEIIHYFTTPTYVDNSQMHKTYSYIYSCMLDKF